MKQLPYYGKKQSGSSQRSQKWALLKITRSTVTRKTRSVNSIHADPYGSRVVSEILVDDLNHIWCSKSSH